MFAMAGRISCYGRMHPETENVLSLIAKRAARRRGFGDHRLLLRRARNAITVQIWRRAAAMIRTCLPLQLREGEGGDLAEGTDIALIESQTDAKVIPPAAGGYHFS